MNFNPITDRSMKIFTGEGQLPDELIIRHFQSDAFGIVGARNLVDLQAPTKRGRRSAVRSVYSMLRAFKLIFPEEQILSVSTGSDAGGESIIVITSLRRTNEHADKPRH